MNAKDLVLNPKTLRKNPYLAQVTGDSAWNLFVAKLEYKAKDSGKIILRVGQFSSSSKICHV